MSDRVQEKTSMGQASAGETNAQAKEDIINARRKVIKAGIIGIPVILTLKSKPAWAQETTNGSMPSGISPTP